MHRHCQRSSRHRRSNFNDTRALVFLLGFSQHMAQGTALAAMIPPIGLLAAYEYYKNGYVNIPVALLIAAGFIIGGFAGAKLSAHVDENILKKIFGLILFLISIKIFFDK